MLEGGRSELLLRLITQVGRGFLYVVHSQGTLLPFLLLFHPMIFLQYFKNVALQVFP